MNNYIDTKIIKILGKQNKIKNILVLSGGGPKGFAHIGVLKALEEFNILKNINTIASCSIGTIVSVMFIIGYTVKEMIEFAESFDFNKLRGIEPLNFLANYGLDNGEKLIITLKKLFEAKKISNSITFKELYKLKRINLIMSTVCLNNKNVYYLSHKTFPDLEVITGIRMSTSVPIWFVPVNYHNKLYIDGGCIDNYPIELFKDNLDQVIGACLCDEQKSNDIDNFESFFENLVGCLCQGILGRSYDGYDKYTIKIRLQNITLMDLNMSIEKKRKLLNTGYEQTINFLNYL
jgi:NTE family protein